MHFNKIFRRYYIYVSIFFVALYIYYDPSGIRTTQEEKTFKQLELALVDWYYKYNPTIATKHNIQIYNNEIEKNDATSIEEYNADINRFIIELSQIDQTRLSSIYLEKYLTIESFLYKTKNDISNFQYHSYDPFYYMQIMYNSLLYIMYNKELSDDVKYDAILNRLRLIPNGIYNIQKNLDYYSEPDIIKTIPLIKRFNYLVNNLNDADQVFKMDFNQYELESISTEVAEVSNALNIFQNYINEDLSRKTKINKRDYINNYISYDKEIAAELDYSRLINEVFMEMFEVSLPLYTLDNDEPVWVDKQDSIIVINSILRVINKEGQRDTLLVLDSLNNNLLNIEVQNSIQRIDSFGDRILPHSTSRLNHKIYLDHNLYIGDSQLYGLLTDNSHTYIYIDSNKSSFIKNKYKLDLYNIRNYFPGRYFQILNSRKPGKSVNNIILNNYTNFGWGLFIEELYVREGYGDSDNNFYIVTHLDNLLKLIIKSKMFYCYYIEGKDETEILDQISDLSIYDRDEIELFFQELIDSPLETNFTIIGYFKLKEIYDKFIVSNPSSKNSFYDILLNGSHLSPELLANFKLIEFYE